MNNTEKMALRNSELNERNRAMASAEKLIKSATKPLITTESMEKFSELFPDDANYNEKAVRNDIRYTERKRNKITNYDIVAHAVEYMVGDWLDDDRIFDDGANLESPKASRSSEYDDYSHGVDISKTWVLSDESRKEYNLNGNFTIAIDVTTSKDKDIIYHDPNEGFSKLSQFSNGLPYGFTSIKYYAERNPSTNRIAVSNKKTCVPRFVIGLDRDIVSSMLRNSEIASNLGQDSPRMTMARFKVLSEIRAQVVLFLEKLPDEKKYNHHRSQLKALLDYTEKPLINCAESMIPYPIESSGDWTPTYETKIDALWQSEIDNLKKTSPKGYDAIEAIDQLVKNPESSCYDASYSAIMASLDNFRRDNPGSCQPKSSVRR